MRYRRGHPKSLLHEAFRDKLPASTWKRRKMGFGVPLAKWFRRELRGYLRDSLLGENSRCHQYFSKSTIEKLFAAHDSRSFDHSHRLWTLLFLEVWLQKMTSANSISINT
jgi:asparagine synthase (glutamine-hydrolysing)